MKRALTGRYYQRCTRCVMDTTDPEIEFDEHGICNHCTWALERMQRQLLSPTEREAALQALVDRVKADGKGKRFDCIIGVSGGIDSTATAYIVKKLGLRPLAVHFDNGWNSELAVDNIKRTLESLDIPLDTYVVEWEEFRDLLLSFMKASVANCEAPTDHAIMATLFRTAHRERVRYILSGSNIASESIMPHSWSHYSQDLRHLKGLHRRFGSTPLRTMPMQSLPQLMYYVFAKRIRQIPFLNYVDYNKQNYKEMLEKEIGWRDYGGKHYESVWTRFFQGYYLPTKFGYDKRKAHLSALICSEQMTRDEAICELAKPIYDPALLQQDMSFVIKKFGLTDSDFRTMLQEPGKAVTEYQSHHFLFCRMKKYKNMFRTVATRP